MSEPNHGEGFRRFVSRRLARVGERPLPPLCRASPRRTNQSFGFFALLVAVPRCCYCCLECKALRIDETQNSLSVEGQGQLVVPSAPGVPPSPHRRLSHSFKLVPPTNYHIVTMVYQYASVPPAGGPRFRVSHEVRLAGWLVDWLAGWLAGNRVIATCNHLGVSLPPAV